MPKTGGTESTYPIGCITMDMPRRFRRRMAAPRATITSLKNQHGRQQTTVPGTKNFISVMTAIAPGEARVLGSQVPAGAHVYSIACDLNWIHGSATGDGSLNWYFIFMRSGQEVADAPSADWSDIGLSNLRNQIIYSELNSIGTEDAGPIKRRVRIKVPKLYQRIREGDVWRLIYDNTSSVEENIGFRFKSFT